MAWWRAPLAAFLSFLPLSSSAQSPPEPSIFRTGTRLVEVEVVVRGQRVRPPGLRPSLEYIFDSGPPFGPPGPHVQGLAKDDFTLLDQGRPQPIAVFRAGPASLSGSPMALPAGMVSNRQDSRGQAVNGATAVLIDFLNTRFGCRGYERAGMAKLLRSFTESDRRIALYTLGVNLHVLHDFGDDPGKLIEAAAKLDRPSSELPRNLAGALSDLGDVISVGEPDEGSTVADRVHSPMTVKALKLIIDHLSGVPGRKNLVWLMEDPRRVPPQAMAMAQQANVVLYPVLVRLVPGSFGADASCVGANLHVAEDLAAITGGRAFFDVLDLGFAMRATEEDTDTAFTLGYYPTEDMLDGKYHKITLKIHNTDPDKRAFEVHYRPGYLATKVALSAPAPTLAALLNDPFEASGIGLTGQASTQAEHPGLYDVRLTVDLHDIHLDHKDGNFIGAFDVSLPNPSAKGAVRTGTVTVGLKEGQLGEALENGFPVLISGAEPESGEIRVVVRDPTTGAAGALRIPVGKPAVD